MARKKVEKVDPEYQSLGSVCKGLMAAFWSDPDYEFDILGKLPSKKNSYQPMSNGKGMFKPAKIVNAERMIALQIPGELKGLNLEHPHMIFEMHIPKKSWRSDSDNAITLLLDCLVKNDVLRDDSINHCNGFKVIIPVVESSEYKCKVRMWKNE